MKVQNIQPVVFSSKQKMMSLKMTEDVHHGVSMVSSPTQDPVCMPLLKKTEWASVTLKMTLSVSSASLGGLQMAFKRTAPLSVSPN